METAIIYSYEKITEIALDREIHSIDEFTIITWDKDKRLLYIFDWAYDNFWICKHIIIL